MWAQLREDNKANGKPTGPDDLLFPHMLLSGEPMSSGTITNAIKNLGYRGRATGHGFRSTFSGWCNENAFNADAVERQLAHVDGSTRGDYNRAKYLPERI